jgi:putative sterol carrier protein
MADKYPFLSEEWMQAARDIRKEYEGKGNPVPHQIRMNLCITDVPGQDGPVEAHMDTSSGELVLEEGHLDSPDLTVTVDGETAKSIFIEGNQQAGMQAFMAGKVKVQGDMTKLMMMQAAPPDPTAVEVQQRLAAITA